MRVGHQEEPDGEGIVAGGHEVAQGGEAAGALRHLLPGRVGEVLRVKPYSREGSMVGGLGLRDLVLVVRKHEVDAPRVDVQGGPEVALAHRRAFDVPSGTAAAERRVPRGADLFIAWL